MPIREYTRSGLSGDPEGVERIFLAGETPPPSIEHEGRTLLLSVSAARFKFKTLEEQAMKARGERVWEPGMDRDIRSARRDKERKHEEWRRKFLEQQVQDWTI